MLLDFTHQSSLQHWQVRKKAAFYTDAVEARSSSNRRLMNTDLRVKTFLVQDAFVHFLSSACFLQKGVLQINSKAS